MMAKMVRPLSRKARALLLAARSVADDAGEVPGGQLALAQALGINLSSVRAALCDLEERRMARRVGSGRVFIATDAAGNPALSSTKRCQNCGRASSTGVHCPVCKQWLRKGRDWYGPAMKMAVEGKTPIAIYAALVARGFKVSLWGPKGDEESHGVEGLVPFLVRQDLLPRAWLERRRLALAGEEDDEAAMPRRST